MSGDTPRAGVVVRRHDFTSALARGLIERLDAELRGKYPEPGATHFRVQADDVAPGRGAFLVAFDGPTSGEVMGEPVGCGAVRRLDDRTGEIKRMFVVPEHRGRGIGHALLAALEAEARALGLARLLLETGVRQHAAIALYERAGFAPIPPYGEYTASAATSYCMAKEL